MDNMAGNIFFVVLFLMDRVQTLYNQNTTLNVRKIINTDLTLKDRIEINLK